MAKMFDKVSHDFLSAIKGVLEAKKLDPVGKENDDIDNDGDVDKSDKYLHNRRKAIKSAMMKKEEAEQIDELSTGTLQSYRKKARAQGNSIVDKMKMGGGDWSKDQKDTKTLRKRAAGAQASGKQLVKRGESLKTEETELDEAKIWHGDYTATSEKSKFGGHRPKVVHKEKGHTMYLGQHSYKKPETARKHAEAYLTAYSHQGERSADAAVQNFVKAHKNHMHEEVEQVDEISTKLATDYSDKASDARGHRKLSTPKLDKRYKSVALAHEKIRARHAKVSTTEEVEELDELSHDTLRSYRMKAKSIADHGGDQRTKGRELASRKSYGGRMGGIEKAKVMAKEDVELDEGNTTPEIKKDAVNKELDKSGVKGGKKRKMYHALLKGSEGYKSRNEEVENLDELSKSTLGSYIKKAAPSAIQKGIEHGVKKAERDEMDRNMNRHMSFSDKDKVHDIMKTTHKDVDKPREKALRRNQGIIRATNRLTKEEIEMIESKLAGVADGSMEGDKHMCATKVFHKEWAEGTPIKTMHADPDADGLIEWYDVMFDHGIERVMTEDMEILQAESHMHSKRKMKEETEELDEARGRPKKAAAKDFTVHPVTKEKLMHNNPAHMKKIELLQKNKVIEKPKVEAAQHIMNQLQKAKTSMHGGSTIHFTHGESKHVSGTHAAKLITKYQGMKPSEKEDFQKKIGHSHEQLMKHV